MTNGIVAQPWTAHRHRHGGATVLAELAVSGGVKRPVNPPSLPRGAQPQRKGVTLIGKVARATIRARGSRGCWGETGPRAREVRDVDQVRWRPGRRLAAVVACLGDLGSEQLSQAVEAEQHGPARR